MSTPELSDTRSLSPVLEGSEFTAQIGEFIPLSFSPYNLNILADRETIADAAQRRESPSTGATLRGRIRTQKPSRIDAVYNSRPPSLIALPITVYSPVFARFMRLMATDDMLTHEQLDIAKTFVEGVLPYYSTEGYRIAASQAMAMAVHPCILTHSSFTLSGQIRCTTDGAVRLGARLGDLEPALVLSEVSNEIGEAASDPSAQAECAYVTIYSSKEVRHLFS